MLELRLSELARSLGVACESGDAAVTGLAIDSRAVKPGDLFVAIDGERVDGHDFIDNALDNGAAAIACTRPLNIAAPHIKAVDSHQVCAIFGQLIRGRFHGSVIGITGSAGKTTAKSFLESICGRAGATVATLGNQNNVHGVLIVDLSRLSLPA